jgi:hypothetical protein
MRSARTGPIPAVDGAADYALSRLYYVKCQQYLDGAPLGYLTVSYLTEALVNEPAEGTYWKIDGGDFIWFKDPSVGSHADVAVQVPRHRHDHRGAARRVHHRDQH